MNKNKANEKRIKQQPQNENSQSPERWFLILIETELNASIKLVSFYSTTKQSAVLLTLTLKQSYLLTLSKIVSLHNYEGNGWTKTKQMKNELSNNRKMRIRNLPNGGS